MKITTYEQIINAIKKLPYKDVSQDYSSSSVYVRVTKESTRIVEDYIFRSNVTLFRDSIENALWYEFPFMKLQCTYIEDLNKNI